MTKINPENLSLRPAKPGDAEIGAQLVYESFPNLATFIIGLGSETRAKRIITRVFAEEGHRLSYSVTMLAEYRGKVVGVLIAHPGQLLGKLNRKTNILMLKQYRLRGKFLLIVRGWPEVFIREAYRDEYLVSNMAVNPTYRGRGVGSWMLAQAEKLAQEQGLKKVALQVAIESQSARRLYESSGYKVKALQLESNKRVAYVGAGYARMVKELT